MKKAFLLGGAVTAFGCSGGGTVDIGDDDPASKTGQELSDFVGDWDGYAETFQFNDDSDRIRISLDETGQGTVRVGDTPLYPPASDFEVGYPPDQPSSFQYSPYHLEPGLLFSIHGASADALRIRLDIDAHGPYRAWCQMQTPKLAYLDPVTGFHRCVLGSVDHTNGCVITDPETQIATPIDCAKVEMCQKVCGCTTTECGLVTELSPDQEIKSNVLVDAALSENGTVLDGTLTFRLGLTSGGDPTGGSSDMRVPIRLTRQ